jgi:hypothetical protein
MPENVMHPRLTAPRAAAPVVVRLEELEERTVPSLFGLLGGSGSNQSAGGLLSSLGPLLSSVTSLVDHIVLRSETHHADPVVGSVSVGLNLSQPATGSQSATGSQPATESQPLSLNLSAVVGSSVGVPLTVDASVGGSGPLLQVNATSPIAQTSAAAPGGNGNFVALGNTQTVVTVPEPIASTVAGTGVPGSDGSMVRIATGPTNATPVVQVTPTAGSSNDLASLATAVTQLPSSAATEGTTVQAPPLPVTTGSEQTATLAAAAARAADVAPGTPSLLAILNGNSVLFAVGGSQTPGAFEQTPPPAVQLAPAGSTAVPDMPQRTLPQPAGMAEEDDPLPGEEPDLISACPSQVPPALDALMSDVGERIGTAASQHWLEWTPWLALLSVGAGAYGLGRRRRTDGTTAPPRGAETLSL